MKVLLLCDDYYHPGNIPTEGFLALQKKYPLFFLDVKTKGNEYTSIPFEDYKVVVFAKSDQVSQENRKPWKNDDIEGKLVGYVEKGGGLLFIHSGTTGKNQNQPLHKMRGCFFDHHPEQCNVTIAPLKPHPITKDVKPFTQKDEHYFITIFQEDVDMLFASSSIHGIQPSGYTRLVSTGRVCVLTPGHNLEVWLNEEYQKILYNALMWCGKEEGNIN